MSNNNNNQKMKGLLKGLRYISQIFDEEKEQEMKIGLPTDVKHVAHIGWDGGPSVDSAPSWMKDFKAPGESQSGPLNGTGEPRDKPEVKWVSEDSNRNRRSSRSEGEAARDRDLPDVPRSRRHASSENIVVESVGKEGSTKSRKSKASSKSSRQLLQQQQPEDGGPESPSKKSSDVPKKTRRSRPSRSKESDNEGSVRSSSRSKETEGGRSSRSSRSKGSENGGSSRSKGTSNKSTLADSSESSEFGSNNNKELTPPFVEEQKEGK